MPEHRYAEFEDALRSAWRVAVGDRFRAAREDDAAGPEGADFGLAHVPGMDLAVHAELAHAAGDELGVLRTEVQDQDAVGVDVGMSRRRCG